MRQANDCTRTSRQAVRTSAGRVIWRSMAGRAKGMHASAVLSAVFPPLTHQCLCVCLCHPQSMLSHHHPFDPTMDSPPLPVPRAA